MATFADARSFLKANSNFSPEGKIASTAYRVGKKMAFGTGAVFGAIMAYFIKLGAAAAKGAIIGATIGGGAGLGVGGFLGFQVGLALAPFTFGLSIPVFTVLGATTGAFIGGSIGAVTGGLIAYGIAANSTTAVSMGVGTGVGGAIGGYAGFAAGSFIAGGFVSLAAAACAATLIGCVLVPIAAVSSPIIIATTTALGAAGGAIAGAYIGKYVGENLINPIKNAYTSGLTKTNAGLEGVSSGVGSGFSGIGSAISGAFSSTATFATGIASSVWGFGVSTAGSAASWLGGAIGQLGSAASSLASSAAGIITTSGAITVGAVTTGFVLTAGATAINLSTTEGDLSESFQPPGSNEFFTITKSANPPNLGAPGPNVNFKIVLTAKDQPITTVSFVDNFRFQNANGETPLNVPSDTQLQCTTPIAANSNCEINFNFNTFLIPNDSTLVNTILANVTLQDGTTKTDSSTVSVRIGNPPTNCPSGWPLTSGTITQGPTGSTSHAALYPTEQAIDIGGNSIGTPTFATFTGIVVDVVDFDEGHYGLHVDIQGQCNGIAFKARWAHLQSINSSIQEGQAVSAGQQIGTIDATGNVDPPGPAGTHLHYSFFGLDINDYIPQALGDISCNGSASCNVSW